MRRSGRRRHKARFWQGVWPALKTYLLIEGEYIQRRELKRKTERS